MRARLPRAPRTTEYDLPLVAIVLGLVALGLAMVYSASGIRALDARDDPSYFLVQQSAWAAIGIVGMVLAARLDHRALRRAAVPLGVVALILLVVVLVPGIGTCAGGACRWLRVTSFAGIQPAELAKLALIVYLAFWLAARRDRIAQLGTTGPFIVLVALVAGLVVAEPDLGTAIVIGAIALALYFAAGARLVEFAGLGALAGTLALALAVAQPYRLQRLLTFLDPWSDPRGAGFQSIQSLYGLALGGPFGEGLGAGREKFGFLPAPYTDSIFSVIGNELGMVGTGLVIFLFLAFAFRGTRIALRAPNAEGALLAMGITVWLASQAWLNMAVVASLVPMTGITLPFISYGGSSLCVGLVAVGILLSVGRAGAGGSARVPDPPRGGRDGRPREPAARGRRGGTRARRGRAFPLPWRSTRAGG
ncbi:MAG: putative lipid II flippase FtsW [Chloroflexota bacterium]|nr:putative lipid II flippase FtsW [Chloroflexota bacterium]MDE3194023.1 putative lipid II flippase FtsW [Chloroflexota bacterium]